MAVISVGIGGFLGAIARYYIDLNLNSNSLFPWGTFAVNLAGSFFIACFLTIAFSQFMESALLVHGISTGFIGSLTTFSSVSVEAIEIGRVSAGLLVFYVLVSIFGGLLMAYLGRKLGRAVSSLYSGIEAPGEKIVE
ncbi:MAG: CrcB family protein [Peptococcaceae bacterium]|nr:CrcB family protein [Peptococcaceae bacterium]